MEHNGPSSTNALRAFTNLSGDHITFDVGSKVNQKIKIVGTYENPWFCGKDVCEILEYKNIQDVLFKHVKQKYKKDLKTLSEELKRMHENGTNILGANNIKSVSYHEGKAVYINKEGLTFLLTRSKTPSMVEVAKILSNMLGLNIQFYSHISKEQDTIGAIRTAFAHFPSETQFSVGPYRVDLYFPRHKIAVECDEFGHRDRDPVYEKEREEYIRVNLNCRFLRFNPDSADFNIFYVINRLMIMIHDYHVPPSYSKEDNKIVGAMGRLSL